MDTKRIIEPIVSILEDPTRDGVMLMPYMASCARAADYGEEPVLRYIGTDESEDRYGTVIDMAGWETDAYLKSATKDGQPGGVFLWAHQYAMPSIGRCVKLTTQSKRMLFDIRFAVEHWDFAALIYRLASNGFMNGCSVGFIPKDREEYESTTVTGYYADNCRYTKQELLELSSTPVGANRNALTNALAAKVVTENELRHFGLDRMVYRAAPILLHSPSIIGLPWVTNAAAKECACCANDKNACGCATKDKTADGVCSCASNCAKCVGMDCSGLTGKSMRATDPPADLANADNPFIQSLMTAANLADEVVDLITSVLVGCGVAVEDSPDVSGETDSLTKRSLRTRAFKAVLAGQKRESKVLSSANEADLTSAQEHLQSIMDRHTAAKDKAGTGEKTFTLSAYADSIIEKFGRDESGTSSSLAGDHSPSESAESVQVGRTLVQLAAKSDDVFDLIFRSAT